MNEIRAITIFMRAATLGSLRKAAVDQGISPQAASHAVMQLEKELGVRLFFRTTRKLSLTAEGQRFFESVIVGLTRHETQVLIFDPGFGFVNDKSGRRIRYRSDAADEFHF